MIWEREFETMAREELEQLQLERLEATLARVYMHVPFYRKKFDDTGFDPDNFRTLEDLSKLPFTTKQDLRDNYPYDMFAVPLRDVVRVHSSSGTTGAATVVGYTQNDINRWSNLVARVLTAGGVTKDDVVQIAFGYGLFTGGLESCDARRVCLKRQRQKIIHDRQVFTWSRYVGLQIQSFRIDLWFGRVLPTLGSFRHAFDIAN